MAFPSDPTIGEEYLTPDDILFTWDGEKWVGGYPPSLDYKGATGATGPQGPNDFLDITVAPDVDENRPILFSATTASSGTVAVQSEQLFFNPGKNQISTSKVQSILNVESQAHSILARSFTNSNLYTDNRIGGREGFYREVNLDGQDLISPFVALYDQAFFKIKMAMTMTSDNHGSISDDITYYNNFDGNPPITVDVLGNQLTWTETSPGSGTFFLRRSLFPLGGNPNMNFYTTWDLAGGILWYVSTTADVNLTGQVNGIADVYFVSNFQ